ncbi:hypothetical protein F5Y16DRAFT_361953 [Xylariaceae sp. FL0255]|nr:hypothetical protein F5Y16DRAFT_361953 [Xylariaceae sp. FL0255]
MATPGWDSVRWESRGSDGIFLKVLYRNKYFDISLFPPTTSDTIEGGLIDVYNSHAADHMSWKIQAEIESIIYKTGGSIWDDLAPSFSEGKELNDLHTLLYPETFKLRFVTIDGKGELELELVPHELGTDKNFLENDLPGKIVNDIELPEYSSRDVVVLDSLKGPKGYITKVLVGGRVMCCKAGKTAFHQGIEREFDCLRNIAVSKLARTLRVPQLLGLVTSADSGDVIGLLEEFIPTGTLRTLGDLQGEQGTRQLPERIKKWMTQVRETVSLLHEIGVVWGDGNPDNVMIHKETDDAWLVDFGGSCSVRWSG